MRELSYGGFNVLHAEALQPVYEANIPVHILNTNNPSAKGTRIVASRNKSINPVVGVSGEADFSCLYVSKYLMNREVGFGRKLLEIIENENIPVAGGLSYVPLRQIADIIPIWKDGQLVRRNGIYTITVQCELERHLNAMKITNEIKEKIEKIGVPLKDWNIKIYRGILTGCNEAFIIDGATKDALIAQDPKSAEIIRPILRGRDIKRYSYEFADKWLIATHNGTATQERINIEDYPAVKMHLDTYYAKIAKRDDQGDTPYNLRCCAYWDDFSKQKIVWARLMRISKSDLVDFPRFSLVKEEMFPVDSLCFFTGEDLEYLQSVLNSGFAIYWFFNNIAILDNGGMQMRQQYIENFPIPGNAFKDIKVSDDKIFELFDFTYKEVDFIKNQISAYFKKIIGEQKEIIIYS